MPIPASKPRARLNEDQAVQIFQSKIDSPQLPSTALATLYLVDEKTIRDIWKGRTWSRETWHLDTSRAIQLKQPGRPKGRRDTQPRKKRASGIFTAPSPDGLRGPDPVKTGLSKKAFKWQHQYALESGHLLKTERSHLSMNGYEAICADEYEENSEESSSWDQSDPSLSYNTVERQPPSTSLLHESIDAQLYDWHAFWISFPTTDPFRREWVPKPFEYA